MTAGVNELVVDSELASSVAPGLVETVREDDADGERLSEASNRITRSVADGGRGCGELDSGDRVILKGTLGRGLCMMGGERSTCEGPAAGDDERDETAVTVIGEIGSKGKNTLD